MVNTTFSKSRSRFFQNTSAGIAHIVRFRTQNMSIDVDTQRRLKAFIGWYAKRLTTQLADTFSLHVVASGNTLKDQEHYCAIDIRLVKNDNSVVVADAHGWDLFGAVEEAFRNLGTALAR